VIALLAIGYALMAEVSRQVASTPQAVTPVWPSDGLAVGTILIFGHWGLPGVLVGSFLANIGAFSDATAPSTVAFSLLQVLGIAVGTTGGTWLGTTLLKRAVKHRYALDRVLDVLKFLILTAALGPVINATAGVTILCLSGKVPWPAYSAVWLTWWLSNVSGIVIVTPMLLSCHRLLQEHRTPLLAWCLHLFSPHLHAPSRDPSAALKAQRDKLRRFAEVVLLLCLVLLISQTAFGGGYALEYMLIPLLLWSAFRLGQATTTLLTFLLTTPAILGTVRGVGSFAHANRNQSLLLLQLFIGVVALTALVLSATIAERKRAEEALRQSEATQQAILSAIPDLLVRMNRDAT